MVPDSRLLVFAKYPRAGRVKTRLVPDLTPDEAADLYRAFLCDSLATYLRNSKQFQTLLLIADEGDEEAFTTMLVDRGVVDVNEVQTLLGFRVQCGDDLGERLSNSFREAFSEKSGSVCAIGTDHPTLPEEFLGQSFDLLNHYDIVVGPAADGGYYLIGMNQLYSSLFKSMPWSQQTLFDETLREAARLNLSVHVLPQWYDVDDADSLFRLAAESDLPTKAPRTAEVLRSLNYKVGRTHITPKGAAE